MEKIKSILESILLLGLIVIVCFVAFTFYQENYLNQEPEPLVIEDEPEPKKSHNIKAEVYQWKDENGVIQFSDAPPKSGGEEVRKKEVLTSSAPEKPETMDDREALHTYQEIESGYKSQSGGSSNSGNKKKTDNRAACDSAKEKYRRARTETFSLSDSREHTLNVKRAKARVERECS